MPVHAAVANNGYDIIIGTRRLPGFHDFGHGNVQRPADGVGKNSAATVSLIRVLVLFRL